MCSNVQDGRANFLVRSSKLRCRHRRRRRPDRRRRGLRRRGHPRGGDGQARATAATRAAPRAAHESRPRPDAPAAHRRHRTPLAGASLPRLACRPRRPCRCRGAGGVSDRGQRGERAAGACRVGAARAQCGWPRPRRRRHGGRPDDASPRRIPKYSRHALLMYANAVQFARVSRGVGQWSVTVLW